MLGELNKVRISSQFSGARASNNWYQSDRQTPKSGVRKQDEIVTIGNEVVRFSNNRIFYLGNRKWGLSRKCVSWKGNCCEDSLIYSCLKGGLGEWEDVKGNRSSNIRKETSF